MSQAKTVTLNAKQKFNALSNAAHIFSFKEESKAFKIHEIVNGVGGKCKAIVELKDGSIVGLYTDSFTAKDALHEVLAAFDKDQPFIKVNTETTGKGNTIYKVEVQD